ncbi:restriction endonuclease subunit S [Bifidobacterium adolescentis]|uniref:restriction endonuclease subunit S n=2 Tax=Bifidobacterium adolescentis TaxID=1680 RepID=UPI0034A111CE
MAEQHGKTLVPQIRFAGFTDPWEQRKLGDVATIVGGGTPSTNNDAYWDGDIDWYSPAELGEQVYADRSARRITQAGYDSCSATLLPAGKTILFTSRAGIGNTAILRRSACTNQGFQSLVVNDDTDVYFVYSMTDRIKNFAEQKASGSTFLEISGKGLAAGEFAFPSKDEQTAIGSMFKQLDHLITLHQRKYDKLCVLKKSMLDKMFPKGGSLYPEIRFAGFTDPWEQRKLGDVATIVGGGTPSTNNDAYWDGDIDWYSPAELGEQVYADRSARRITQAGYDSCSATLLPAGKTILFTSRAGIGNTAILRRSACTNQGFQSLVVNDDTDVYFVYSMTDRIKNFAEQKASGSTFLEISGKGLAAGEFAFPSKDEQTAIGSMFKQLDHLITLHQRKLELLRNIKKSMLDKMFV